MKILLITAGAAGMYCGSCLRDNALAAALMAKGHDVLLLPLYTPTRTDEPNVSHQRVFFGGISVYLQQRFYLFRKIPWILDRLWDSPLALRLASNRGIQTAPEQLGELTVSMLQGEHGLQSKEVRKLLTWLKQQSPPDVINLPNALLMGLAEPLKSEFACPLFCTLQGEDLFLQGLEEQHRLRALQLIRANLQFVDAFVAVSQFCADFMAEYIGIPRETMHVLPLGINVDGYPEAERSRSGLFKIGYLARIAPEKGLHVLAETYRKLRREWQLPESRLEVSGYLAPEHKGYLEGLQKQLGEWGLAGEFRYHGAPDRAGKIAFLKDIDVLSVPAPYDEPKGIFLLEAMAMGVPVVQPRRGAFTEIVQRTSGGLLVEPDSHDSLAEGIFSIYKDPALAETLGRSGREGVRNYYTVDHMAERMLECYKLFL
ncbi:MAG: glycosyltransferase family 4 protein [Acidobacteriota bacterium]